jgi:hypothetical protein
MIHSDYPYIRRHFLNPQSEERLYAFLRLPCSPSDGLSEQRITEKITHYIQFCKRNHFGTVIPCFATATTSAESFSLERFRFCYDLLLSLAQQAKIHVAFHLERALEVFLLHLEEECYEQVRGIVKILNYVLEADVDDEIPPTSLVREFIGGNTFYK